MYFREQHAALNCMRGAGLLLPEQALWRTFWQESQDGAVLNKNSAIWRVGKLLKAHKDEKPQHNCYLGSLTYYLSKLSLLRMQTRRPSPDVPDHSAQYLQIALQQASFFFRKTLRSAFLGLSRFLQVSEWRIFRTAADIHDTLWEQAEVRETENRKREDDGEEPLPTDPRDAVLRINPPHPEQEEYDEKTRKNVLASLVFGVRMPTRFYVETRDGFGNFKDCTGRTEVKDPEVVLRIAQFALMFAYNSLLVDAPQLAISRVAPERATEVREEGYSWLKLADECLDTAYNLGQKQFAEDSSEIQGEPPPYQSELRMLLTTRFPILPLLRALELAPKVIAPNGIHTMPRSDSISENARNTGNLFCTDPVFLRLVNTLTSESRVFADRHPFLEVGSHTGDCTLAAGRKFRHFRAFAFEVFLLLVMLRTCRKTLSKSKQIVIRPLIQLLFISSTQAGREAAETFRRSVNQLRWESKISVYHRAVAAPGAPAAIGLKVPIGRSAEALQQSTCPASTCRKERVLTAVLDHEEDLQKLFRDKQKLGLVKMHCQGCESDALKGMEKSVIPNSCALLMLPVNLGYAQVDGLREALDVINEFDAEELRKVRAKLGQPAEAERRYANVRPVRRILQTLLEEVGTGWDMKNGVREDMADEEFAREIYCNAVLRTQEGSCARNRTTSLGALNAFKHRLCDVSVDESSIYMKILPEVAQIALNNGKDPPELLDLLQARLCTFAERVTGESKIYTEMFAKNFDRLLFVVDFLLSKDHWELMKSSDDYWRKDLLEVREIAVGGGISIAGSPMANLVTEKVTGIYRAKKPDQIAKLPELLAKYRGREEQMYAKVCKKYKMPMEDLSALFEKLQQHEHVEFPKSSRTSTLQSLILLKMWQGALEVPLINQHVDGRVDRAGGMLFGLKRSEDCAVVVDPILEILGKYNGRRSSDRRHRKVEIEQGVNNVPKKVVNASVLHEEL